jgi:SAM-dependent methyltransferase
MVGEAFFRFLNEKNKFMSKRKITLKKYSKSSNFYKNFKGQFFDNNDQLLEAANQQNEFYAGQPKRNSCKLCGQLIPKRTDFISHGVDYVFCGFCGHLNGVFDDTKKYAEKIYISDSGSDYAKNYLDPNYEERTRLIYEPKLEFLKNSFQGSLNSILDVGCGAGYFVAAAQLLGVDAKGIDVSKTMVDFGNSQIKNFFNKGPLLTFVDEDDFYNEIINSKEEVISAIGVIEHLREPDKFFDAFRKSDAKYLYYSVPMFSLSVILENVFPSVFPRHLSGGHTHLFTEKSIEKMHEIIGASPMSEWRFGTDIMDLYRASKIMILKSGGSEFFSSLFDDSFAPLIDNLQAVLDESHFCSEIHALIKKDF